MAIDEVKPKKLGNLQHKIGSALAFLATVAAGMAMTNPRYAVVRDVLIGLSGALGVTGAATNAAAK